MRSIDLNADAGEGFDDALLLPWVSSINVACGGHAGDDETMRAIDGAVRHGVSIGAHPGLPDRAGFGRVERPIRAEEAYALVCDQVQALTACAAAAGARVRHVKPHGALYNMSARDAALADAIARAVRDVGDDLVLFGLSGSVSISVAQRLGVRTAAEAFADRQYQRDGTLVPRTRADALVRDAEALAERIEQLARGEVAVVDGSLLRLEVDTICVHGDGPHAATFAHTARCALEAAGYAVAAP